MAYKSYTLSGLKANLYGLLFALPALTLAGLPYMLIWCDFGRGFPDGLLPVISRNTTIILMIIDNPTRLLWAPLAIIAGIVLHELIHGAIMAACAENGWKSISFGFSLKSFAPYTHCSEPLKPNSYRASLIMPGILLGDIPVMISWITGNVLFLIFGIIFYCAAAGDMILLWMSRNITDGMMQDHPEKIGFVHQMT